MKFANFVFTFPGIFVLCDSSCFGMTLCFMTSRLYIFYYSNNKSQMYKMTISLRKMKNVSLKIQLPTKNIPFESPSQRIRVMFLMSQKHLLNILPVMLTLLFIVSRFQYIFNTYKHIEQAQLFFLSSCLTFVCFCMCGCIVRLQRRLHCRPPIQISVAQHFSVHVLKGTVPPPRHTRTRLVRVFMNKIYGKCNKLDTHNNFSM